MPLRQVNTLTEPQIAELHELYRNEWWTKDRSLDDVRIMVENSSLIIGSVDEDEKLVAFCRRPSAFAAGVTGRTLVGCAGRSLALAARCKQDAGN